MLVEILAALACSASVALLRITSERPIYDTHGHKLRFPPSEKAQFVTVGGIFDPLQKSKHVKIVS